MMDVIILGGGLRGRAYAEYAYQHPDQLRIAAIAEPNPERRAWMAQRHGLTPQQCFETWQDLVHANQLATAAINATLDREHTDSTLALLEAGYDVLLEKPMSPVLQDNVRLIEAAEKVGRLLQVCHVLRFSPFWRVIHGIVQSGRLGRVISVDHRENLVYWHMAHSFVRGNWSKAALSGPMILAKCCHDFDLMVWILRQPVVWLHSFGSLSHFRPENAPEGAPMRCTDGCPAAESCKYYAPRLYARDADTWPYNVLTYQTSVEARLAALKTGPYGHCVYHAGSDVVDHQTVTMELADGTTVSLLMNGQGYEEGRTMRYDGTEATLTAKFSAKGHKITLHHHRTGQTEAVLVPSVDQSGHGGGDFGVVRSFLKALAGEPDVNLTTARESLESHLLAFAAEESRLTHQVIQMSEFRKRVIRPQI